MMTVKRRRELLKTVEHITWMQDAFKPYPGKKLIHHDRHNTEVTQAALVGKLSASERRRLVREAIKRTPKGTFNKLKGE